MPETQLEKRVRDGNRNLAAGILPHNPRLSPFNILASTCPKCDEWFITPWGKIPRRSGRRPHCPECNRRRALEHWERDRHDNERRAYRTRRNQQAVAYNNSQALAQAANHYKDWTGPELEIAARKDLSASQVAKMLGRTIYAVKTVRIELARDPRKFKMV